MNLSNGRSLTIDKKFLNKKVLSVRENIVAQIPVSRKYIPDEFNELCIQFSNHFTIIFRAYNDGIAYRIQTSFSDSVTVLKETAYKASICRDGINADRNAMDYIIEKKDIIPGSKWNIHLAPSGGFVIRLIKE